MTMYQETQLNRPIRHNPNAQRPPEKKQTQWLPYIILGALMMGAMAIVACIATLVIVTALNVGRIPGGVTVAGVDVGGKQAEQATAALQQALAGDTVTLMDNDRAQDITLAELGISVDYTATVEQAQEAESGAALAPVYTVDLVQAQSAFISLSEQFNVEPVYDPPTAGRSLEIPVLLERLRANVAGELADSVIELPMIEVAPPEASELTTENYSGTTVTHVVEPGQELGLIAKQYNVPVESIVSMNGIENPDLLWVGQELMIPAAGEYVPTADEAPAPPTTTGKAIVVSVDTQRIYAFENGELVRSHLVSTGLSKTPTVLGDYSVYVKYAADDMSGPDYFLPQVPYTMYFFSGYAIHGTYWHSQFGRPMSHGCVNLPVDEAEWFFNWAQVGTPVRVVA